MHEYNESKELFTRLGEELYEGRLMCFTGKISRIVNAFVGFIDGIEIQISSRAEFHARVSVLIRKMDPRPCKAKVDEIYLEFLRLISTQCDLGEEEFNAWLESFRDLVVV